MSKGFNHQVIPSIETIVEDLLAGRIAKLQAVMLLRSHAEGATNELRDHFAAEALNGMISGLAPLLMGDEHVDTCANYAHYAYRMADHMLAARKEKK